LTHECEIHPNVRDSGFGSGQIRKENDVLFLPFGDIALGVLLTLLSETDLRSELKESILGKVEWKGVPLIELAGDKGRIAALSCTDRAEGGG
jgi:hypothetical protein